ncbi:Hypothetical protein, putative [Bodo saltans]|uniref:Uncharacterized protein n=1 Tax=Bodo saltans TaxID=75058 RepID=A0A0S4JDC3_BODSA|nr:Hypothetical protein, putative [Bodo saltans]|eukprot:CUG87192.1 Hypothetical protein, putative [Bodo saltans]
MSPKFDEASPQGERARSSMQMFTASPSPSGATTNRAMKYSVPRDAFEHSIIRSDEDMTLIHALRRHIEALEDDNSVRIGIATSLGKTVLHTQKRCGELEQKSVSLETSNAQLRHALELSELQLQTACHRAQTLEDGARERDEMATRLAAVKPMEELVASLKAQNESLEAQMVDWKTKVKEALKEGKKREQQLTSAAITSQTEISQLQEKLNEATFQLQAASARQSKQRVSKEVQTEQFDPSANNGDLAASYVGSPMLGSESGAVAGIRRRRSMFQSRDRAGSMTFSPTMIPPALLVSGPMEYLPVSPGLPIKSNEGGGGARPSYTDSPQPLMVNVPTVVFPHPLPPLNPQLLASPAGVTPQLLHSPKKFEELQSPEAPPFIVTVHFSTPGGWSIDAKQRVPRGMTVEGLMQQCARQFSDRYQQVINVDHMCVRMNHEKAKRSVILHRLRDIHSYSVFQRYQRDGTPIVLFLAPRDDMQEFVQHKLQQRLVEELAS